MWEALAVAVQLGEGSFKHGATTKLFLKFLIFN